MSDDFDSPWKDILEGYFPDFMAFFFPAAAAEIDWSRGFEPLDKELAQVNPQRGAVMIPMTAGMVVLAYNVPGITGGLALARDVYLDIFAGRIRTWNDPRIGATNPGVDLPATAIGTTDFLYATPAAFNSSSVLPTEATSGCV